MGCPNLYNHNVAKTANINELIYVLGKELVDINNNLSTLSMKSKEIYEIGKKVYSINSTILNLLKSIKRLDKVNNFEKIRQNCACSLNYYYNCYANLDNNHDEYKELKDFNIAEIQLMEIKNELTDIVKKQY